MSNNICSLQPLSGLSLAHTIVYSNVTCLIFSTFPFYYSNIYALYSLPGLSLAHICLLTGFALISHICLLQPPRSVSSTYKDTFT